MDDFICYADGSCLKNPGKGGWGVLIEIAGERLTFSGSDPRTTNNVMELTAAIEALKAIPEDARGPICSDSQYVVKGVTEWRAGWERKNFAKVANADLWKQLFAQVDTHPLVRFKWVRGHNGDPLNEAVDVIARTAAIKQS